MYHSNLARAPTLPLLSKLSIRPIPPHRSHRRTSSSFCPLHTTRYHLIHLFPLTLNKPRPSGFRILSRSVHQRAPEAAGARSAAKTPLPWIRDSKGAEKKPKPKPKPAAKTSWEAAAERYLSKNEASIVENADREPKLTTTDREVEEDGDAEHVDNPRWSKIKSKYAAFVGRDRESRFEKPEEDGDGDGDAESIDNPKWSEVRSKYTDFVARDRGSRFEKPEVHRWNKQESWGRKTWKEASESSSVPRMVGQGVYGVCPVLAALSIARREFYALYVQEGLDLSGNSKKKKDKKGVEKVMRIADRIGLKVVEASKHDLNMVVDNRPHQGLVLDASPLEMVSVKEMEPPFLGGRKPQLWVALDEVTDPQNLGAIIRSAYYFGAEGVIMCAKNSAPLSGVVSKASAGALELIELMSCKNMMQFLSSSVDNGWRVLGGSVSSRAVPLSEVEVGVPTILVLGSEGTGLRPLVERSCTELIRIPGGIPIDESGGGDEFESEAKEVEQSFAGQEMKNFLAVESLNVSVAAGVLLYHLVGKNSHLVSKELNDASELLLGKHNVWQGRARLENTGNVLCPLLEANNGGVGSVETPNLVKIRNSKIGQKKLKMNKSLIVVAITRYSTSVLANE